LPYLDISFHRPSVPGDIMTNEFSVGSAGLGETQGGGIDGDSVAGETYGHSTFGKTAAEKLAEIRRSGEGAIGEMLDRLKESGAVMERKARSTAAATDAYVSENPWKVLGVAAIAGIVIGLSLSRR
jgi:ElaB/YqjD/DUF883 family membrane-anchored ribosome-binding protein